VGVVGVCVLQGIEAELYRKVAERRRKEERERRKKEE
jgi:hypothetical protein